MEAMRILYIQVVLSTEDCVHWLIHNIYIYNYVQPTKTMSFDKNTGQHCYQKGRHNAESNIQYKSGQEPHDGLGP